MQAKHSYTHKTSQKIKIAYMYFVFRYALGIIKVERGRRDLRRGEQRVMEYMNLWRERLYGPKKGVNVGYGGGQSGSEQMETMQSDKILLKCQYTILKVIFKKRKKKKPLHSALKKVKGAKQER